MLVTWYMKLEIVFTHKGRFASSTIVVNFKFTIDVLSLSRKHCAIIWDSWRRDSVVDMRRNFNPNA